MMAPLASMKVTSPFGPRGPVRLPDGSVRPAGHHNGVDLRAAVGTNVFSPVSGVFDHISYTSRGALQAFVIGDDDRRYAFVHLADILVPPGSRVAEGEAIALSGDSGGVAPHLHLEVRERGQLIDPMTLFSQRGPGPAGRSSGGGVAVVVAAAALIASRFL